MTNVEAGGCRTCIRPLLASHKDMKTKLLPKGLAAGRSPQATTNVEPVKPAANAFELHMNAIGAWMLEGPADYMEAHGIEVMNAILEGTDQVFDQLALKHRDWRQAVLARLTLDYVHWHDVGAADESMTPNAQPGARLSRQRSLLEVRDE